MTPNIPAQPISLIISPQMAQQSLHRLIADQLGSDLALQVLEHGGVWLNHQRVTDTTITLTPGMHITLHTPPDGTYSTITIEARDICYEDPWLLVLNKQPLWYTNATPWDMQGHVLVALTQFLAERDGTAPYLRLAHQLDRGTSGLLLCSKDPTINAPLQAAFASGSIKKHYWGICCGEPERDSWHSATGHGRMRGGRWRTYPLAAVGERLPGGSRVKLAMTEIAVQQRLGAISLVEARPQTGRTHQIRLHLAAIGHPLLGDTRYGGASTYQSQQLPHHLLHAAQLSLQHPATGKPLQLSAPPPAIMQQIMEQNR